MNFQPDDLVVTPQGVDPTQHIVRLEHKCRLPPEEHQFWLVFGVTRPGEQAFYPAPENLERDFRSVVQGLSVEIEARAVISGPQCQRVGYALRNPPLVGGHGWLKVIVKHLHRLKVEV